MKLFKFLSFLTLFVAGLFLGAALTVKTEGIKWILLDMFRYS